MTKNIPSTTHQTISFMGIKALYSQYFKLYTLILPLFCLPVFLHGESDRYALIDEHLQLFLPGNDVQQQTARSFAKQELQQFITDLENQRVRKKNKIKAIHIITTLTHERFFQNPSSVSSFSSLFKLGQYTATTSTALYSLIFEYFQLPYLLVLQEDHVAFWADPGDHPQELSAFARSNETNENLKLFIQNYPALLEIIDGSSKGHTSGEQLYWAHFFGKSEVLSIKELASYLSYSSALEAYGSYNYDSALSYLAEAEFLSPQPIYHVIRKSIWLQQAAMDEKNASELIWKKSFATFFRMILSRRTRS